MNRNKFVLISRLAILFIFFATGCNKKQDSNVLTMQLTAEPMSLDFSKAEDGLSYRVFGAIMSGLTRTDANQKLQNEMAEKIEILNHGSKYRVTLKDWKWSDGKNCTAQDYVFGFKRTLDPKTISKLSDLLFFIKNALPYKKGILKDFSKVGIVAIDERTLEFNLEGSFLFFPKILSLSIAYPQREDLILKWKERWTEHLVTTGPYLIQKWEHDKKITLDKNPYYNFENNQGFQKIEMLIIPDDQTALRLFENNKLDILFRIPTLDIKRFREKNNLQEFPYFATFYLAFNQKILPWSYRFARAAIAQVIDREAIVKILGGSDLASTSWIPEGIPGANQKIGLKFNPDAAMSEWKKLPQALRQSKTAYLIGFDSGSRNQLVIEKIQADIKKHLGVEFKIKNLDWKSYVNQLSVNTPPLYRFGFLSVFTDAFAHLFLFESGNPNNYTHWKNPDFDRMLHQIAANKIENSQKTVDEAQKLILEEEVVVVPIFHYRNLVGLSDRIKGFNLNGLGLIDFRSIQANP